MKLTTKDLRTNDYGTCCGSVTQLKSKSLSQEIIINYIDEFFGGIIEDAELYGTELAGGVAHFSKIEIDDTFIKYTDTIKKMHYTINDIADWIDVSVDDIKNNNISDLNRKDIICFVFSCLVNCFDGSLRVETSYDESFIEIESE